MERPVVSEAAERAYARLPAYWKAEGDDSDWVLLHMCEAAVRAFAKATEALRHDPQGSGWRRMLDPTRCPTWALDWLRQTVGLDRFPPDYTEQQKRDAIRDAPRFRRGSRQAIRNALALHLTETKSVWLIERDNGESRHYRTAVLASEAPDQQRVIDEAKLQKPGTFLWNHDFVTDDGWAAVELFHAAGWTEVEADFTGWHHVLTDPTYT